MLTLLFSSLQTSLSAAFSKPFLLGSFLPLVVFLSGCAGMMYRLGGKSQTWVGTLNPTGATGFAAVSWNIGAIVVLVGATAVILSGLNGFLLELFEGKHLGRLAWFLQRFEWDRFHKIHRDLSHCQTELSVFEYKPKAGQMAYQDMVTALLSTTGHPIASAPVTPPASVKTVLDKRRTGRLISFAEMTQAQNAMLRLLSAGISPELDRLRNEMIHVIFYAHERLGVEVKRLHDLRQLQFAVERPGGKASLAALAPTRFGNITQTIRSYALDRYGLDLNIFWTRLQGAMVKEKDGLSALQDAKVQVDFLVSLVCLTVLFTLIWSWVLLLVAPRPFDFVWVSLGGPVLARILYLAAFQNYIVFADQMRSSIDLYRSDLIDQLRLPKPQSNTEEQELWERVGGWLGYADKTSINYKQQ